jgi:hypothetical protein
MQAATDDAARRELKKAIEIAARQEFKRRALRSKIKKELTSHAIEVIELCTLAGLPDRAAGFIGAHISLENVRNALQIIRYQSQAPAIGGHITVDASGNESRSTAAIWSKAIADARNHPEGK